MSQLQPDIGDHIGKLTKESIESIPKWICLGGIFALIAVAAHWVASEYGNLQCDLEGCLFTSHHSYSLIHVSRKEECFLSDSGVAISFLERELHGPRTCQLSPPH